MMAVIERKTSYQNDAKGRFQPNLSHENYVKVIFDVISHIKTR